MTTISAKEQIDIIRKTSQEILTSKEAALRFLINAGIIVPAKGKENKEEKGKAKAKD